MSVFDQSRNMLHSAGITCQTHWSTDRDPKEISQVLSLTYISMNTDLRLSDGDIEFRVAAGDLGMSRARGQPYLAVAPLDWQVVEDGPLELSACPWGVLSVQSQ